MSKSWENMTKKELLALPRRNWCDVSIYKFVLFVNTKTKHDSGFNLFAIIGCKDDGSLEIAGYMDDFRMFPVSLSEKGVVPRLGFAFDCSMHGVFRLHSNGYKIGVGANTSTTDLFFVKA